MGDDKKYPRHIRYNGKPMIQHSSSKFMHDPDPPDNLCECGAALPNDIVSLQQQLKVMTEDRDEYAKKARILDELIKDGVIPAKVLEDNEHEYCQRCDENYSSKNDHRDKLWCAQYLINKEVLAND